MSGSPAAAPYVATTASPLWFLGTLARMKLTGAHTGGRFALWEGVLPHGAAPPLHSHPQDETFYMLEGSLTVWIVDGELAADRSSQPAWQHTHAQPCGVGSAAFVPAEVPHTFRVESGTARLLFLSTPASIEDYVQALAEPACWPWLQPPPDGPRVSPEHLAAVERELEVIRPGPPPALKTEL